jgi:S-DNA-T family DNA segregation ATPase FtsK/SpoIIIE
MTSELANPEIGSLSGTSTSPPDFLSRLHLSVGDAGDRTVLLDPRGSVRQLVVALGGGGLQGLRVERTGEILAPGSIVGYADIRSGDRVEFVDAHRPVSYTYVLCFLTGARAGERFVLPTGETRIGRAADNHVTITDPAMSRHHAVLTVDGDTVMLADAGSTNGVMIGDHMITAPTPLQPGQRALVGQSWFEIVGGDHEAEPEMEEARPPAIGSSNRVELHVLHRPVVPYLGDYIEFPEPPDRPRRRLRTGRDGFETAKARFDEELQATKDRLVEARRAEMVGRLAEAPSVSDIIESITSDVTNCWGASVADGVVARVGLATRPTRTHMLVPGVGDPELREELTRLAHDHELIEGVPATVRFAETSSVVITGAQATGLAQSLMAQLVGRYRPSELGIWAMIDPARVESWDWLKWLPHCGGLAEHTTAQLATSEDGYQRLIDEMSADPTRFPLLLVDAGLSEAVVERLEEFDYPMSVLIVAGDDRPQDQRSLQIGSEALSIDVDGESASMSDPMIIGVGYETTTAEQLDQLARTLSPVVESDLLTSSLPPVPGGCTYSTDRLVGTLSAVLRGNDPAIVAELWDMLDNCRLSTVIGHEESGPVELALDVAPHAIVAGQYECFLPAWLATLSAGYSPHHFNFFLFDCRNGLVFRECRSLPHCVGAVDDMRPVALKSALAALSAELDRREAVLASVGVESIQDLKERTYVLPRLVVAVDQLHRLGESAGLNPVGELIELAWRGRRLGLHLVIGVGAEPIHESDVLETAPDDLRDLVDLDAVVVHLPRPGVGRLRRVGSEPTRFTTTAAGRRPEIVVHQFDPGDVDCLYRGPIQIDYQDDLARLITQVTKAYDYSGGVRPSWLV